MRVEIPFIHTILRYVPNKRARQIAIAPEVVYKHGVLAIQNLRNANGNTLNLFGKMLAASDSQEKISLTDQDIREEAKNFTVAGADTTAVTLTYLVWAVLKQPDL
jgi:cytochrome P450